MEASVTSTRPTLARQASRFISRTGIALTGSILGVALPAAGAFAIEEIRIVAPTEQQVRSSENLFSEFSDDPQLVNTVVAVSNYINTNDVTISLSGLSGLADGTRQFTNTNSDIDALVRGFLNAGVNLDTWARSPIFGLIDSCPSDLALSSLSQIIYLDDNRGDYSGLQSAMKNVAAESTQGKTVKIYEMIEAFGDEGGDDSVMTIDFGGALSTANSVYSRFAPLVNNVLNLTVRDLTAMNEERLNELLVESGFDDPSDRENFESALKAFKDLDINVELSGTIKQRFIDLDLESYLPQLEADLLDIKDELLAELNVGTLITQALSGNWFAIGNEADRLVAMAEDKLVNLAEETVAQVRSDNPNLTLETLENDLITELNGVSQQVFEPLEVPISKTMFAVMEVADIPVSAGVNCRGIL